MTKLKPHEILKLREIGDMDGTEVGEVIHMLLDLYEGYEPYISQDTYLSIEEELKDQLLNWIDDTYGSQ